MPVLLKHQPWNDGRDEEGDVEVAWDWRPDAASLDVVPYRHHPNYG